MSKRSRLGIIATLMIVVATVSPMLLAQNKQPNGAAAPDAGKILWQFNTNG